MIVYRCTNTQNGKAYIGKSSYPLKDRWRWHCSASRAGSSLLLHRAVRKYGVGAFEVEVVATAETEEALDLLERATIAESESLAPRGYNLREGGEGGRHSEDTKAKIGAKARGRCRPPEATLAAKATMEAKEVYPLRGPLAPHEIERLKGLNVGRPRSEETRRKISEALKGRKHSEETKGRIRDAKRGTQVSPETRSKISAASKGKQKPEGFGAKVSSAMKGRTMSAEHLENWRKSRWGDRND